MEANAIQYGGDHYKGSAYQHWDFANDLRLPYLVGVATKYFFRWRKKNGVEDLEKGIHYLEKCIEVSVTLLPIPPEITMEKFWLLAIENNLTIVDAMIIYFIVQGEYNAALQAAEQLLAAEQGSDV